LTAGILEQTCLNTNDIIHETIAMVRSNAEAQHVRITLDLAASLPLVSGDRIQVRQVLLNLMRNVFEAMHQVEDGSRVLVARTTSTTPGGIVVAVQDCGPRIDETSLARLFHPFFTTKAGRMGLGLALSRSITRPMKAGHGPHVILIGGSPCRSPCQPSDPGGSTRVTGCPKDGQHIFH
jgi:C4-dicarboxylate-specific signal transduction histidine kinase